MLALLSPHSFIRSIMTVDKLAFLFSFILKTEKRVTAPDVTEKIENTLLMKICSLLLVFLFCEQIRSQIDGIDYANDDFAEDFHLVSMSILDRPERMMKLRSLPLFHLI